MTPNTLREALALNIRMKYSITWANPFVGKNRDRSIIQKRGKDMIVVFT